MAETGSQPTNEWVILRADGIDIDLECGCCGWTLRSVSTDPAEARRIADAHVCDEEE